MKHNGMREYQTVTKRLFYATPHAAGRQSSDLDRHGDDRAQAGNRSHHRSRTRYHRRRIGYRGRGTGARGASGRRNACRHGLVEPDHARPLRTDRQGQGLGAGRSAGGAAHARLPARACAAADLADVRQFDLPGPAVSRAVDARARGLLSLSRSRRGHVEGALSPVEARGRERLGQAGQARGTRRYLRVDRRAQILSRHVHSAVKFCSHCGFAAPELRVPDGDTLPRYVCGACGTIHYQNPKVVVGCLPVWHDKVLLRERAIEARPGLWTLPAGFLENGETILAGAERETAEEARARVDVGSLYTMISLPHINQIYVMFHARLLDLDFGPGSESLEVKLFDESDIPWSEIAFRTITRTLRNYFLDRKLGEFPVRVSALEKRAPLKPELLGAG